MGYTFYQCVALNTGLTPFSIGSKQLFYLVKPAASALQNFLVKLLLACSLIRKTALSFLCCPQERLQFRNIEICSFRRLRMFMSGKDTLIFPIIYKLFKEPQDEKHGLYFCPRTIIEVYVISQHIFSHMEQINIILLLLSLHLIIDEHLTTIIIIIENANLSRYF